MRSSSAFISHAREDKDRFVLGFAERLRKDGVDAWLDKWEMLPGDSLVDRIFEEGIGSANAFIIVVSRYSINKKWVKEELNAGMVQKINGKAKLIPVIIDKCEVPKCLESTVWESIDNLNSYDDEYNRILNSIYGVYEKPELGNPPEYTKLKIDAMPGLSAIDTRLLLHACEQAIETSNISTLQPGMFRKLSDLGLSEAGMLESLEVLDSLNYVKLERVLGGGIPFFSITFKGLDKYLRRKGSEYEKNVDQVCLCLINERIDTSYRIAEKTSLPIIVINHFLKMMAAKGLVKIDMQLANECYLLKVSPLLRRQYADR